MKEIGTVGLSEYLVYSSFLAQTEGNTEKG